MNILSIGNSFSEDAFAYLDDIANSNNLNVNSTVLYIPGCDLETHYNNFISLETNYEIIIKDIRYGKTSLDDALKEKEYDYVTIQQASHYSGQINTYEPFTKLIIEEIRKYSRKCKIVFIRTWAYEKDSDHGCFSYYNKDQSFMWNEIVRTTEEISKKYCLPIIPCGDYIDYLRKSNYFNYDLSKRSLCRDGYHLSYGAGRYISSLAVINSLFPNKKIELKYFPTKLSEKELIEIKKAYEIIQKIQ